MLSRVRFLRLFALCSLGAILHTEVVLAESDQRFEGLGVNRCNKPGNIRWDVGGVVITDPAACDKRLPDKLFPLTKEPLTFKELLERFGPAWVSHDMSLGIGCWFFESGRGLCFYKRLVQSIDPGILMKVKITSVIEGRSYLVREASAITNDGSGQKDH